MPVVLSERSYSLKVAELAATLASGFIIARNGIHTQWCVQKAKDILSEAGVENGGSRPFFAPDFPWCDACQTWHSVDNPTCTLRMVSDTTGGTKDGVG